MVDQFFLPAQYIFLLIFLLDLNKCNNTIIENIALFYLLNIINILYRRMIAKTTCKHCQNFHLNQLFVQI